MRSRRIAATLILGLLVLGIARTLGVVLHDPLLGYANQYDMIRVQACHNVWPADPSIRVMVATRGAPIDLYRLDDSVRSPWCHLTSELLFTTPVAASARLLSAEPVPVVSIRVFGVFRAALFALAAGLVSAWLWRRSRIAAALVNAFIYGAILTDPANTLFLNTFYQESSALFFSYTSLVLVYSMGVRRPDVPHALLLGLSLACLAFSKLQHVAIPVAILLAAGITGWQHRPWRRALVIAAIVLVASLPLALLILPLRSAMGARAVHMRHLTQAFLANSNDPRAAARALNLPAQCGEEYAQLRAGNGVPDPCPQGANASYVSFARLILLDPTVLARLTNDGVGSLRPWMPEETYMGHVEGQTFGRATQFPLVFTISDWIDRLDRFAFYALFFQPLTAFLALAVLSRGRASAEVALAAALALTMYAVFGSSLAGDGVADFAKHCHLVYSAALAMLAVGAAAALRRIRSRRYNPPEPLTR